jgi:hypothetical protein
VPTLFCRVIQNEKEERKNKRKNKYFFNAQKSYLKIILILKKKQKNN